MRGDSARRRRARCLRSGSLRGRLGDIRVSAGAAFAPYVIEIHGRKSRRLTKKTDCGAGNDTGPALGPRVSDSSASGSQGREDVRRKF
jgi:hypothetical protein